jgi:UDP-N-acetyl-D-mannosaminuronic acid transferase (WecB/TagA/CpsF family)
MIVINKKTRILNFFEIKFYDWSFNKILKKINLGGYLVAPAASALTEIKINKFYYESIKNSQCAIFDSGFFCILLRLFMIYSPKKFSGFLFLKKFLNYKSLRNKKILLINSSDFQGEKNFELMKIKKFNKVFLYTASFYQIEKIKDQKIINYINKCKPNYIIICIAGGKQEPLASYIHKKIKFKCSTLCIGGAIDFMNGLQAPINGFIDKIYLGWFYRILFNPKVFFIRVFKSLNLFFYFFNTKRYY